MSVVRRPIDNSYQKIAEADFVFGLNRSNSENPKINIIKNRYGPPGDVDDVSIYEQMLTSFVEASYNYLLKNKTEVVFFENCVKDKFKEDLKKFVEDKWREINEDRMSKELKT